MMRSLQNYRMMPRDEMLVVGNYLLISDNLLTQSAYCKIEYDEKTFSSVSHCLIYYKALYAGQNDLASEILEAKTFNDIKVLENKIKPVDEEWTECVIHLSSAVNFQKFKQNPELVELLISTGDTYIIETSRHADDFWGIGMGIFETSKTPPKYWSGKNHTGKILTDLKEYFKLQREITNTK